MSPDLTKKLVEKYPKIFSGVDKSPRESLMCFGFECGDGWYPLIDKLCEIIQWETDQNTEQLQNDKEYNEILLEYSKGNDKPFLDYYKDFSPESIEFFRKDAEKCILRSLKAVFQVEATQVKEKFGGLRFYINGGDARIYGMIDFAEHLSHSICEFCGSMKNIKHSKGWVITACQECIDKDDNLKNRIWV